MRNPREFVGDGLPDQFGDIDDQTGGRAGLDSWAFGPRRCTRRRRRSVGG